MVKCQISSKRQQGLLLTPQGEVLLAIAGLTEITAGAAIEHLSGKRETYPHEALGR